MGRNENILLCINRSASQELVRENFGTAFCVPSLDVLVSHWGIRRSVVVLVEIQERSLSLLQSVVNQIHQRDPFVKFLCLVQEESIKPQVTDLLGVYGVLLAHVGTTGFMPKIRRAIDLYHLELAFQDFVTKYCHEYHLAPRKFSQSSVSSLLELAGVGLDEGLENTIKRGVVLSEGPWIEPHHLEGYTDSTTFSLKEVRELAEKQAIERALLATDGNHSQAAKLLGVTRPTLYNLLEKLKLRETTEAC